VGFSGYLTSLLSGFGIAVPEAISTAWIQSVVVDGHDVLSFGKGINLVALMAVLASGVILAAGLSQSKVISAILVVLKVVVLAGFILVGFTAVDPGNWTPFVP